MCAAIKYNRQPLAQEMPEAPSLGAWQAVLGKYACSILVLLSRRLVMAAVSQTLQLHGPFLSAAVCMFWYLSQQIPDMEHMLICCLQCPYSELLKVLQIFSSPSFLKSLCFRLENPI